MIGAVMDALDPIEAVALHDGHPELMPVAPMTLVSAALMVVVSKVTAKPGKETLRRYFPQG